jgi:hypothetical protein
LSESALQADHPEHFRVERAKAQQIPTQYGAAISGEAPQSRRSETHCSQYRQATGPTATTPTAFVCRPPSAKEPSTFLDGSSVCFLIDYFTK